MGCSPTEWPTRMASVRFAALVVVSILPLVTTPATPGTLAHAAVSEAPADWWCKQFPQLCPS